MGDTPPTQMSGVPDEEDSPATGLGGPSPNPAPAPITTTAPPQPATTGSTLSSILHAVGDALGGPKTGEHGEPISNAARVLHGVGTIAQGVAAGAAQHGPGSVGASGLAGAQVVQKQAQQQKENTLANQKQDQEQLMNKATIAYHNNQMLLQQREADRMDTELTSKIGEANRAFQTMVQEKGWQKPPIMVDGKDINGTQGNEDAMMKYYTDPANHKAPDGYAYAYLPTTDDKGKASHAVYLAPVNSMDQPVTLSKTEYKAQTGIDAPGKDFTLKLGDLINQRSMYAKSTLEGEQEKRQENADKRAEQEEPTKLAGMRAENESKQATASHENAETEKVKAETKLLQSFDNVKNIAGEPITLQPGQKPSDMVKDRKDFNKAYVDPLIGLQKTQSEFHRIETDPHMTPAEKVTGLLSAVGISFDPLKGKGARVNQSVIGEHAQATDIYQRALQKLDQIRPGGGGPITEKQIHDYASIARGVVSDAQIAAAREARRRGVNPDFLPKAQLGPDGRPPQIDADTARTYLAAFDGDVQKAHNAIVSQGFAP